MKNIIITGGELFNKGAMAMTFVAVSELKKRFPNHEIYLLSEMDLQRSSEELEQYAFEFTGWYPIKFAKAQNNPVIKAACCLRNYKEYKECYKLYANCDLMIDISGYALGRVFSYATCNRFLEHIEFAKSFSVPVYLLPQSFGPFDFPGEDGKKLRLRCKENLQYAKKIYAREETSLEELKSIGINHAQLADDLVLCNKETDLSAIFRWLPHLDIPQIEENSVAIIPNGMITRIKKEENVLEMYHGVVEQLIRLGKKVYILSHSTQDVLLCEKMKKLFADNSKVKILSQEFSCIEYNELVCHFDYIVASRYHSIIHAYKNAVPCIAFGWADKYHKLLSIFQQNQYMFDARREIEMEKMERALEIMEQNHELESEKIRVQLEIVQRTNVFDEIEL